MRASRWARSRTRQAVAAGIAVPAVLVFAIAAFAGPVGISSGFEDDDGNLVDNTGTGINAGIDWNSFKPTTWTGTAPTRTSTKTALGWQFLGIEDAQAVTSDTGFAGGTKQDDNCATLIAAKAPNKDDMKRAYLSTKVGAGGHVFLNLAWVRIPQNTTSSSAHIGFEFNKGSTACAGSNLVNRVAGDMLIVYDFEGGGGDPVLTLRRWVTSGACEVGSKTPPCWGTAINLTASGFAEARVNVGASALDEIGPTSETLQDSEFGEAGIDLTAAGVFTPGSCESFGKVFAVSRSSGSSGTAQMKDLVGPAPFSLGSCTATLTTTPTAGVTEATQVSPGTAVTDTAIAQGTNTAGTPPTPTGSVTFFLCGPTAVDSTALCTTGGTQVGSPVALADSAPPAGEASATSGQVNTSGSPLAPGRYCFRAVWPGDGNYTGPFTHVGTGNSECFIVRQIATTTVTTPSNGLGSPLSSPVELGTILFDKAVVTGTAAGGNPPGTVDFFICDPTQVQGAAGAETCATGGTALSGNPRTLVADLASSPPTSSVLSSPGVTADKAGVWCFRAVYTPTGSTYTGSSDATHGECVTVSKAPTDTTTTPRNGAGDPVTELAVGDSLFDSAVVEGVAAGGTPTGSVDFFICDPSQVQGAAGAETCATGGTALSGNPRTLSPDAGSDPPSASATSSPAVVVDEVGTWCFRGVFTPGGSNAGNYLGSSDASHSECVVVKDSTSMTSEQTWLPNDSATVTSAGDTDLNGTLSFTLHSGGDCSGAILRDAEVFTFTDEPSPAERSTTNGSDALDNVTVDADATVSWEVVFDSTSDLVADSEHCEKTTLDITN